MIVQTTNGTASFYRKKMDVYWTKKQENILKAQFGIAKDVVKKDEGSDEDAAPVENTKKRKINWRMLK